MAPFYGKGAGEGGITPLRIRPIMKMGDQRPHTL
jgi:hypothetical protein